MTKLVLTQHCSFLEEKNYNKKVILNFYAFKFEKVHRCLL